MNEYEYAIMRQVEDSFWWYVTLREAVVAEITKALGGKRDARILDAGCGTGGMMEMLRRENAAWQISGLDFSPQALEHTRQRGFVDLTQGSVDALPFADGTFDLVISLDVLYFEGVDDEKAMSEFCRVLKSGGVLVLNLPAFNVLRGQHDVAVKGVRRYTPARTKEMIEHAYLKNTHTYCWNLWLFAPILCWRLLSSGLQPGDVAKAKSDLSMPPKILNSVLKWLAGMDMILCRAVGSPLGTSVFSVARKPIPS